MIVVPVIWFIILVLAVLIISAVPMFVVPAIDMLFAIVLNMLSEVVLLIRFCVKSVLDRILVVTVLWPIEKAALFENLVELLAVFVTALVLMISECVAFTSVRLDGSPLFSVVLLKWILLSCVRTVSLAVLTVIALFIVFELLSALT